MAVSLINVGNAANDGTGDDLREAFIKINQNFQTLDLVAEQVGANLGTSGAEVYASAIDGVLNFRRLVQGDNVTLTQLDNTITISADVPSHTVVISGNTGSMIVAENTAYNIVGAAGTTVSVDNNTKTITIDGFNNNTNPVLAANLDANTKDLNNIRNVSANYVITNDLTVNTSAYIANSAFGNITQIGTLPNNVSYDLGLGIYLEGFDMGEISYQARSILDAVIRQVGVDLGTFASPSGIEIDMGTILSPA